MTRTFLVELTADHDIETATYPSHIGYHGQTNASDVTLLVVAESVTDAVLALWRCDALAAYIDFEQLFFVKYYERPRPTFVVRLVDDAPEIDERWD